MKFIDVRAFCANQHQRKRDGKLNLTRIIDIMFGKDTYCASCWVDQKLKQQPKQERYHDYILRMIRNDRK